MIQHHLSLSLVQLYHLDLRVGARSVEEPQGRLGNTEVSVGFGTCCMKIWVLTTRDDRLQIYNGKSVFSLVKCLCCDIENREQEARHDRVKQQDATCLVTSFTNFLSFSHLAPFTLPLTRVSTETRFF